MTEEQEREFRDEADRLRQLSADDQQRFIAMLRGDADNGKVPKCDRDFARVRAAALERFLGEGTGEVSRPEEQSPESPRVGSSRMRILRALFQSKDPMSAAGIKKRTGIRSLGNVYDVLRKEILNGRIRLIEIDGLRGYQITREGRGSLARGEIK